MGAGAPVAEGAGVVAGKGRAERGRTPKLQGELPWLRESPLPGRFGRDFFARSATEVARALLGARLVSTMGGWRTVGVVVETEAYLGLEDPASHAATRVGVTHRNRAMFGPARHAYVYRSYGMHWCLNVVTGVAGEPQAVLLRGLDPIEGQDVMAARRGGKQPLTSGPGRLCEAMGVTGELYGHDFATPPLELLPGWSLQERSVAVSGRVGVKAASDWPLRFFVKACVGVSRS